MYSEFSPFSQWMGREQDQSWRYFMRENLEVVYITPDTIHWPDLSLMTTLIHKGH